jgi:hypothetical protein
MQVIKRDNCMGDRFASNVRNLENTPCWQIVRSNGKKFFKFFEFNFLGNRYFYWPEKKYCCYCCGPQFCSVLKPTWLTNDGVFKGVSDGFNTFQAQSDGVFVWANMTTGLYQKVYSFMGNDPTNPDPLYYSMIDWDVNNYETTWPEGNSVFDLPTDSGDCEANCPAMRTCGP